MNRLCESGHFIWHGVARRSPQQLTIHEPNPSFMRFYSLNYPNQSLPCDYLYAKGHLVAEKQALMKYCKDQPLLDTWANGFAKHMLFRTFYPIIAGSRIISMKQAWVELSHPTSPGYPWSLLGAAKSDVWKIPGIQMLMLAFFYLLGSRVCWTPIWTSSIKVELRELIKVILNKLRGFVASPLEMTLAMNMLLADAFSRLFHAGRMQKLPLKIGMSKYYRGWNDLAQTIPKGCKARCCDYSSMDASVCEDHQRSVFELLTAGIVRSSFVEVEALDISVIEGFLTPAQVEFLKVREQEIASVGTQEWIKRMMVDIAHFCCHSVIITNTGDLIEKSTGNNSGSVTTGVMNSLVVHMNSCYAFALIFRKGSMRMFSFDQLGDMYERNVFDWEYGDDHDQWTTDSIDEYFNLHIAAPLLLQIGYTMTVENDDWSPVELSKAVFLSHGFWWYDKCKLWVPQPKSSKILSSMLFGSKCLDVRWCVLRAFALLVEGWYNETVREVLTGYIDFIFRNYSGQLLDGEVYGGITWSQIRSVLRTPEQIDRLYVGYLESKIDALKVDRFSIPLLTIVYEFGTTNDNREL